ncbi:MAG: hypothetical protein NVSMB25_08860 [Thermoleophilaceae bacterium]
MLSYAGAPLEVAGGTRIGSLATMSDQPDAYDDRALRLLTLVSETMVAALERELGTTEPEALAEALRKYATSDWLTGARNRGTFMELVDHQWRRSQVEGVNSCLAVVEIADLAAVNARHGRTLGDLLLKDTASALLDAGKLSDACGRLSAGRFGILLIGLDSDQASRSFLAEFAERLSRLMEKRQISATVLAGTARLIEAETPDEALAQAVTQAVTRLKLVGVNAVEGGSAVAV